MLISFNDAFRIVYDYAEQGDAFCQYIIGNVFFWRDDDRISLARDMITPPPLSWAKRIQQSLQKGSIQERIGALQGTVSDETLQENATTFAKEWFTRPSTMDLPCSKAIYVTSISTKAILIMRAV